MKIMSLSLSYYMCKLQTENFCREIFVVDIANQMHKKYVIIFAILQYMQIDTKIFRIRLIDQTDLLKGHLPSTFYQEH